MNTNEISTYDNLPTTSIQRRFEMFHKTNPQVYTALVALARKAKARGVVRLGIGHLWEVARWTLWIEGGFISGQRLNNNYRSRYARLIIAQEPDLASLFETRRLQTT